jgi:hypothetical protein
VGLTDFRETLRERLEDQLGFRFVAGKVRGPIENNKLGCVYIDRGETNSDNGMEQDLDVRVRVFPQWKAIDQNDPAMADMAAELEAVPDDVNGALKAIQTQPGAGFWFFSITGFDIDYDEEWGTEVAVLLRRENPFLP